MGIYFIACNIAGERPNTQRKICTARSPDIQVPERGMILFDIQLYRKNGSI